VRDRCVNPDAQSRYNLYSLPDIASGSAAQVQDAICPLYLKCDKNLSYPTWNRTGAKAAHMQAKRLSFAGK